MIALFPILKQLETVSTALLSTAFLPPVDYLLAIRSSENIVLEACESYQKQSYRNRCEIVTAQGIQTLTLPIVHPHMRCAPSITEVAIEYRTPWQPKLLRALKTAYATAPFFLYYFDELSALVLQRPATLLEYNTHLLQFLLRSFKLERSIAYTQSYQTDYNSPIIDLRAHFHPKRARIEQIHYYQVFNERLPFYANVSSIDLLFNEGGNYFIR